MLCITVEGYGLCEECCFHLCMPLPQLWYWFIFL